MRRMMQRKFVCLWVGLSLLFLLLGSTSVIAQNYPTKPITLIIPFGPGGSSDLTFRTLVASASQILGQPIIIELKAGGGGAIGSELVARAKPDGYTLLAGHTSPNSILPAVENRSNGPGSLEPICLINEDSGFTVAKADAPFKTFNEMISWAKAHPGELTFGTTGQWSIMDVGLKVTERQFGIKARNVTFDGGAQALTALLGGHIMATSTAPAQTLAQIKAGKVVALAWEGKRRHPDLPNVPTRLELGAPRAATVWKGVLAPKGTPKEIIDKLADAFKKMTETEQAKAGIKQLGNDFDYMGPADFAKYWNAEYQFYVDLNKQYSAGK